MCNTNPVIMNNIFVNPNAKRETYVQPGSGTTTYYHENDKTIVANKEYNISKENPNWVKILDENGNTTELYENFNGDMYADKITYNKYDNKNRLLSTAIDDSGDGQCDKVSIFSYNDKNNSVLITDYEYPNKNPKNITYKEFKYGNQMTKISYDKNADGIFEETRDYGYDFYGNLSKEWVYNENNELQKINEYIEGCINKTYIYDDSSFSAIEIRNYILDVTTNEPVFVARDYETNKTLWNLFGLLAPQAPDGEVDELVPYSEEYQL